MAFGFFKSGQEEGNEGRAEFLAKTLKNTGCTDAICPSCKAALKSFPKYQITCKACGKKALVRTHPISKTQVLVSEDQAEEFLEYEVLTTYLPDGIKLYYKEREERQKSTDDLREKFGEEPSAYDVQWATLNNQSLKQSKQEKWRDFAYTRISMANLVFDEAKKTKDQKKLRYTLDFYFEALYVQIFVAVTVNRYPEGTESGKYVTAHPVNQSRLLLRMLTTDQVQGWRIFREVVEQRCKKLITSVTPGAAWIVLEPLLFPPQQQVSQ